MNIKSVYNIPLYKKSFRNLNYSKGLVIYSTLSNKLRRLIQDSWYTYFRNKLGEFILIDSPLLIPKIVLEKSGHLSTFNSATAGEVYTLQELSLRPETCQTIFQYYLEDFRKNPNEEIIIGQISKAARNEKTTKGGLNRLSEFTQMELEIFGKSKFTLKDLVMFTVDWFKLLGIETRILPKEDLPHYSKETYDIEVYDGETWVELASLNDRGVHDLTSYGYQIPILEVSIGLDRVFYNMEKLGLFKNLTPLLLKNNPETYTDILYSKDLIPLLDSMGIAYQISI